MSLKLLVTGRPGVGKTTLVRKVLAGLEGRAGGFYTEEERDEEGRRLGFRITALDGRTGWLARVGEKGGPRIGKYGVDLPELEGIGVAAVRNAIEQCEYIVVDEIGPMELLSAPFREVVFEALASPRPLLATIVARHHPFADQIKASPRVRLLELTAQNRDELPGRIVEWLTRR